eukprot:TRINITY_DN24421_c0_g1_i1.p1 TRINITY_DN24421_c0_g1~~TRINITY_DN24421_c0_g1_i1.p1  ORF type:complete len:172 (+),score=22.08 TRINITY_DN24421_c0_g1_i1:32-547(+)
MAFNGKLRGYLHLQGLASPGKPMCKRADTGVRLVTKQGRKGLKSMIKEGRTPGTRVWNSLMQGMVHSTRLDLLDQMEAMGVPRNEKTFQLCLETLPRSAASSHNVARVLHRLMQGEGIPPSQPVIALLIDHCVTVREAVHLLKSGGRPSVAMLKALEQKKAACEKQKRKRK